MRSQILAFLCLFSGALLSQSDYKMKGNDKGIDVNFMSSYYHQDGDNSAVEGGIGGEELVDFANIVIVNIPLDSVRSISFYGGLDVYSSASTDRIDARVSSASIQDKRAFATVSYKKKNLYKGITYGIKGGLSKEYDYTSFSAGLDFAKEWNQGNSEIGISGQAFFDKWELFFPAELRRTASVSTDKRNSLNLSVVYSQVLTKRLQMAISGEAIYMTGLLSTPFHRVYFSDQEEAKIEALPDARLKIPFSLRLNYFAHERFLFRMYYRYYFDDFGIHAHTANLEVPIKVTESIRVSPFVRFHTQTAADYFAPYKEHTTDETYYTSDYDLSELSSQKAGLAIGYYPVFGISEGKLFKRNISFKAVELRMAYYKRNTGLNAYLGSLNFSFKI